MRYTVNLTRHMQYHQSNFSLGPIIRITPFEVHIKDSSYYDEIYASSKRRREKAAELVARFDLEGSGFSSVSPEDHRKRRSQVEKHFSKQAVSNIEYLIYENIDKLDNHFKRTFQFQSHQPRCWLCWADFRCHSQICLWFQQWKS